MTTFDRLLSRRALFGGAPGLPLLLSRASSVQEHVDAGPGTVEVVAGETWEPLTMRRGVHLVGEGCGATMLRGTPSAPVIQSEGFAELWNGNEPLGPNDFSVRHLSILGNPTQHAVALYGFGFRLDDLEIEGGFDNLFTRWSTSLGGYGTARLESRVTNVRLHAATRMNWNHDGPHDLQAVNVVCSKGNDRGLMLGTRAGGTQLVNVHSWGGEQAWALYVLAAGTQLTNVVTEAGTAGCVLIDADDVQGSLRAFGGSWSPEAIGVQIGGGGVARRGVDLWVKVDNCKTPIVNVGNHGTRIVGTVRQGTTTTVLR